MSMIPMKIKAMITTAAKMIAFSLNHASWSPMPKSSTLGSSFIKPSKKKSAMPKTMLTLRIILKASTSFLSEKRFASPLMGLILFMSGVMGLVVKIKPNCIKFPKTPAIIMLTTMGKSIITSSIIVFMAMACSIFKSSSTPMKF